MQDNPSYWEQTTFLAPFDILIVGCGIVGCAAALQCARAEPGLRIGIIERGSLPHGASTKNAGFASFGSIGEICHDLDVMGEAETIALIKQRKSGLEELFRLISPQHLEYRPTGGYEVFLEKDEERYQQCLGTMDKLNDHLGSPFGGDVFVSDDAVIPRMGFKSIAHVIRHPFEGILHPGKMMEQFINRVRDAGVMMLNGFGIQRLVNEENSVYLEGSAGVKLKARFVIIATNAFAGHLIQGLPLRPARNQVYLTSVIPGLKMNGCFHYDRGFVYFRQVDGRVLIGGARNTDVENEYTDTFGLSDHIREQLYGFVQTHLLPDARFEFEQAWSGIICVGDEKRPIVKMVDERIAVAVRLSGMGVAIGSLVGSQAAQLILSRL